MLPEIEFKIVAVAAQFFGRGEEDLDVTWPRLAVTGSHRLTFAQSLAKPPHPAFLFDVFQDLFRIRKRLPQQIRNADFLQTYFAIYCLSAPLQPIRQGFIVKWMRPGRRLAARAMAGHDLFQGHALIEVKALIQSIYFAGKYGQQ